MMDDKTAHALTELMAAARAVQNTASRLVDDPDTLFPGSGAQLARSYSALHRRLSQLRPDDVFATDALLLELPPDAGDLNTVRQVLLLVAQLEDYLRALLREDTRFRARTDAIGRAMPGTLQDEIAEFTRTVLRRAMGAVNIEFEGDDKPKPPPPPPPPPPSAPPPSEPPHPPGPPFPGERGE